MGGAVAQVRNWTAAALRVRQVLEDDMGPSAGDNSGGWTSVPPRATVPLAYSEEVGGRIQV